MEDGLTQDDSPRPESFPCLRRVSRDRLAAIATRLTGRTLRPGAVVVQEGAAFDRILLVTEGRLKICLRSGSGRDSTMRILVPGDCVCFAPAHLSAPSPVTIECLTEARVCWLSRQDLNGIAAAEPAFTRDVMRCVVERMGYAVRDAATVARRPVRARVAATLIDLARRQGVPVEGGVRIEGLTHEDLAACAGTAREVVSRALVQMRREGMIATGRGRILLKDLSALEAILSADPADA